MNIHVLTFNPFQENTYIIYDEQTKAAAIIDAGCMFEKEQQQLENFIETNGLKVTYLLNTHLHLDHQFGNHFVASKYGVLPLASKEDEPLVNSLAEQAALFGLSRFKMESQQLGGYLEDGQILSLCGTVCHVIATPGHSPGGLCFYFPEEKVLFSGDTLFAGGIGRTDVLRGDFRQLLKSIHQRLMVLLDDVVVYCGHGPHTTIGHERIHNLYLN